MLHICHSKEAETCKQSAFHFEYQLQYREFFLPFLFLLLDLGGNYIFT